MNFPRTIERNFDLPFKREGSDNQNERRWRDSNPRSSNGTSLQKGWVYPLPYTASPNTGQVLLDKCEGSWPFLCGTFISVLFLIINPPSYIPQVIIDKLKHAVVSIALPRSSDRGLIEVNSGVVSSI